MITCNMFSKRPVAGDENFWPFQYIDTDADSDDSDESNYTADFFTQRALEFVQSTTVRETFGLTLKDVLGMDYGTFLYLERIVKKMDKVRKDQLDSLEEGTNKVKETKQHE